MLTERNPNNFLRVKEKENAKESYIKNNAERDEEERRRVSYLISAEKGNELRNPAIDNLIILHIATTEARIQDSI